MPDMLAIVPLRAGSKGLRGKNLRLLADKPLYLHSVEQALRVVGRCAISTDIPDVLEAELPSTCQVYQRPGELALDQTPMAPVLMHLFERIRQKSTLPKIAVLLQATSPLRRDEDIRKAVARYQEGHFELVMSVVKTNPAVLKYGFLEKGCFMPISRPEFCFSNRQSLPDVVRPNGAVYVFSPERFLKKRGLETQSIGSIEMPESCSIDIDNEADLDAAEAQLLTPQLARTG